MRPCVFNLSKEENSLAFLNNIGRGTGGDTHQVFDAGFIYLGLSNINCLCFGVANWRNRP